MAAPRLFLFSGLAADGRMFGPLKIADIEVITPDHVLPDPGQAFADYARRLIVQHGIRPEDFVGGASFGGMLAAEIAQQQSAAGLILLGTCLEPTRLPWTYRWIERCSPLIPDVALRLRDFSPLVQWRLGPLSKEQARLLADMAARSGPQLIREFCRMLFTWRGAATAVGPRLVLHGARDRVIPLRAAPSDRQVLENAGHVFTLTHAEHTSAAINAFLQRHSTP